MSSRPLLVVLLVLACLQSFTTAQSGPGPDQCCFRYVTHRIPVRVITEYKETYRQCMKPGVIFILKSGREVCADPNDQWVKDNMKNLNTTLTQPQPSV